ncbi:FAD dependent oxidoreductase [Periconia macrospinosa]|uniref:FAD dependent oxidoreductase n=1 Tax=Periconia macrospinosa TaxID=97972 RepID=A0A2V1DLM4_9PLEO|nr:FAD dependent oxidoreductase [Periconia macrospinosa]
MGPPAKSAPIIIVGAGIFGLSTALHLARRGYTNVTVFDKQPYDRTGYSYLEGCDAASADLNKIIRSAYGSQTEYQELTFEAIEAWKRWNDELASGTDLPPGMTTKDRVFINCGNLSMADGDMLPEFEKATIRTMEECGHRDTQLVTTDARHIEIAKSKGMNFAMDPFQRQTRGRANVGVLDSSGGVAIADKACRMALHKARRAGVRFILDPTAGAFVSLVRNASGRVSGIVTKDEKYHNAHLTLMACGGWTPSLLPALDGLCEATAGSVVMYKIPKASPLWHRFAPENFPTWMWKMRDGAEGGLYGFPRDEHGHVKIGYRGTKYTNPCPQADGVERSVPVTRWTEGDKLTQIPAQAMRVIRRFVDEYLPELAHEGIDVALTRVCWYTDSFDNHFVVDRVPDTEGLFVATGGSGHAFKYLPNIGNWVVDVIEGVDLNRAAIRAWKWRHLGDNMPSNVLMEGKKGARALGNVVLATGTVSKGNRAML